MKSFARLRDHSWVTICLVILAALFSVGCTSSRSDSGATLNPLAAYDGSNANSGNSSGTVINGTTVTPGSLNGPVITVTNDGSTSVDGHSNAPLLTNTHPGWQQSSCLTCHNNTSNNPDHNYSDDSQCYLCHGTNGLPGFEDTTPPVLSAVVVTPTANSVTVSWKSDEECLSRLILKTVAGDRMEFPVSVEYTTSHKYTVTGLQSSSTYYYELICIDRSKNKSSTSSFSSVLQFQTLAAQYTGALDGTSATPIVNPIEEEEEINPFFTGVKLQTVGSDKLLIEFSVRERPSALYYYIYDKDDKELGRDDIDVIFSTNYRMYLDHSLPNGEYRFALKAYVQSKEYKSRKIRFRIDN